MLVQTLGSFKGNKHGEVTEEAEES